MNVLLASAEMTPYASTGGLGEVAGALPGALARAGATVLSVMPMYRSIIEDRIPVRDTGLRLRIPLGFTAHSGDVWELDREDVPPVYFIRRDEFFDRRGVYGIDGRDYDDNLVRFVFFQKAVVALIDALGLSPDIVHAHDWSTGLLPLFLRHGIHGMGRRSRERTVFTVHNLAYQGVFSGTHFPVMNLPFSCFSIDTMEFYGKINCMKAGLTTSDRLTTVSEGYARDILTPEHGCGLEGVLDTVRDRLVGILNGIDAHVWDPATDPLLTHHFAPDRLAGRRQGRAALRKELGLDLSEDRPLAGMVTRLVDQKGLDILAASLAAWVGRDADFVLLGSGDPAIEKAATGWPERWPGHCHVRIGYDVALAHRIKAACDLYLMPSAFEPCGLGQLYALRYGALPVVHSTGGLKDTIRALTPDGATGNGIRMQAYSAKALLGAIREAAAWVTDEKRWPAVQTRLMREDHSWTASAQQYLSLYQAAAAS